VQRQTVAPDSVLDWVDSILAQGVEASARTQQRLHEASLRSVASTLQYALRIRGHHSSGISYQKLVGILAAQGRDFAADSRRLRDHVAKGLVEEFADDARAPSRESLKQVAGALILEWVLNRLERNLRDVPIRSNASAYRAWKRKHSKYSAPGMRSGELRDALAESGRIAISL
jgi:hypothetical protein